MPDMPEEYAFAWQAWSEINNARSNNGYGPNPISFSEIKAYVDLTGTPLLPYEIKGIRVVDTAFMKSYSEVSRATQAAKKANQETQSSKAAAARRR
jgi:hypothetical protein